MNADRVERRFGILVDMFWRGKSRHVGAVLKPGRFDERNMRALMADEEAHFVEVKAALRWVFVDDTSKHWATALVDVQAFCRAYRTICDQVDGWLPVVASVAPAAGVARVGADHIASQPLTPEAKASVEADFERMTGERLSIVADTAGVLDFPALRAVLDETPRPSTVGQAAGACAVTVPRKDSTK